MNFKKLNIIIGSIYAILFIIGIILLINQKWIVDGVLSGKIININENKAEVECISSKCTKYGDKVGYTFDKWSDNETSKKVGSSITIIVVLPLYLLRIL